MVAYFNKTFHKLAVFGNSKKTVAIVRRNPIKVPAIAASPGKFPSKE